MRRIPDQWLSWLERCARWVSAPPLWVEVGTWIIVIGAAVVPRLWIASLLPTYVWSEDSNSYVESALRWLDGGGWVTSSKRGPLYSVFVALVLKLGGTFWTVVVVQHVLGVLTVVFACAVARRCAGPASWLPLLLCGTGYAMHGLPVYLEHLIRSETLLATMCALWLGTWALGLRLGSRCWMASAGLFAGLLQLGKGMFPLVPLVSIASVFWPSFPRAKRLAAAGLFCLTFALTWAMDRAQRALDSDESGGNSQMGKLLYARVAQWTVLDGGIEPELKEALRPSVAAYLDKGQLDNNWVLKKGPAVVVRAHVASRGGDEAEFGRLCRRLAMEAIMAQPGAFLRQVANDAVTLHRKTGRSFEWLRPRSLLAVADDIETYLKEQSEFAHLLGKIADADRVGATIRASASEDHFEAFHRWVYRSWLFREHSPVMLATLCLLALPFVSRGWVRPFAAGLSLVWFFSIAILCTVGRPLDRYIVPLEPMMLGAMIAGLLVIGGLLRDWIGASRAAAFSERQIP